MEVVTLSNTHPLSPPLFGKERGMGGEFIKTSPPIKTKTLLPFIAIFLAFSMYGQKPTLELTFTAVNDASYVPLDSIMVMNQTQGAYAMLFWPDTVLTIDYVGMSENTMLQESFYVMQNYPNPVSETTTIALFVPEKR
jgi:hypothetical protein